MDAAADTEHRQWSGRVAVVAFGAVIVAVVGYFALGMPGMGHSPGTIAYMDDAAGDP